MWMVMVAEPVSGESNVPFRSEMSHICHAREAGQARHFAQSPLIKPPFAIEHNHLAGIEEVVSGVMARTCPEARKNGTGAVFASRRSSTQLEWVVELKPDLSRFSVTLGNGRSPQDANGDRSGFSQCADW
jgi:hypothetical protein